MPGDRHTDRQVDLITPLYLRRGLKYVTLCTNGKIGKKNKIASRFLVKDIDK